MNLYEGMSDIEIKAEEEFKAKIVEVQSYYRHRERTTIDGEWTYDELKEDLWGEAHKYLHGDGNKTGWLAHCLGRALKDPLLLKEEYLVEDICDRYDLIEVYNKAYDMHRNDKPMMFGIHYFDELARAEVAKTLKNNLITK